MSNSDMRGRLRAIEKLRVELDKLGAHARSNWLAWAGIGYPAGVGESSIGRSRGMYSPTEASAVATVTRHEELVAKEKTQERDRFGKDLADFDAYLVTAEVALERALRLARAATNTVARERGAAGCCVCERVAHPENWQEVYSKGLCSFCWEFLERYRVEPSRSIVEYHLGHLGQRVPHSLIREEHPIEFERAHGTRR